MDQSESIPTPVLSMIRLHIYTLPVASSDLLFNISESLWSFSFIYTLFIHISCFLVYIISTKQLKQHRKHKYLIFWSNSLFFNMRLNTVYSCQAIYLWGNLVQLFSAWNTDSLEGDSITSFVCCYSCPLFKIGQKTPWIANEGWNCVTHHKQLSFCPMQSALHGNSYIQLYWRLWSMTHWISVDWRLGFM